MRTGVRRSRVSGTSIFWSASLATPVSPSVTTAITRPPRARTSSTLLRIFWYTASLGATNTTGMRSSISAMGPCFISAAG